MKAVNLAELLKATGSVRWQQAFDGSLATMHGCRPHYRPAYLAAVAERLVLAWQALAWQALAWQAPPWAVLWPA